jgi:ribosomal protein S18 acetylase RimI-like enzyme
MEEASVKIKNATSEDINGIKRLTKQLCSELGKRFSEIRFKQGIMKRLNDPIQRYFLAEKGEKIIGMVFAEITDIDNDKQLDGFLKTVCIDEAYRGLKIGEKLINSALEYFREKNIKTIRTNIHRKAKAALNLYKKLGFKNEFGLEPIERMILKL